MDDLQKPLSLALARLRELIRDDPALRQHVSELCAALLGTLRTPRISPEAPASPAAPAPPAPLAPSPPEVPADRISPVEALTRLNIGAEAPAPIADYSDHLAAASVPPSIPHVPTEQLADAGKRCAQKAERLKSLSQSPTRRDRTAVPPASRFDDASIPALAVPSDSIKAEQWAVLAGCYMTLADAIDHAIKAVNSDQRTAIERTFANLAEASNALRTCLHELAPGLSHDTDQDLSHKYLKYETKARSILIRLYMKRSDRADPKEHAERRQRFQSDAAQFGLVSNPSDPVTRALNKLAYDLARIESGDFAKPLEYLQQQLRRGIVKPSDPALAACLVPYLDRLKVNTGIDGPLAEAVRYAIQFRDKPAVAPVAPPLRSTPTLESVVRAVVSEFPDRLALCLNSRSELAGNPFEDTPSAERALRFLATTYYLARTGESPCPNLPHACREQSGFDFSSHQSETTMGQYENEYYTTYEGERLPLEAHLRAGTNKDARYTLRIAFHWHEQSKIIVLGYIGQHQRNRKT